MLQIALFLLLNAVYYVITERCYFLIKFIQVHIVVGIYLR